MKITTFDPLIVTSKANDVINTFSSLGFEQTHAPTTSVASGDVKTVRMKSPEGYHIDIADVKEQEKDSVIIRMNVDNYDEAYDLLIKQGFKNTRGDGFVEAKNSKATTMVAPSGFTIALVEHTK